MLQNLAARLTAASRLNLAQSFNGLGCILAPVIVGSFLFSDTSGSVALPYTVMGVIVLCVAAVFCRIKLPEIKQPEGNGDDAQVGVRAIIRGLWSKRRFRLGLLALFCYEVAEISIKFTFYKLCYCRRMAYQARGIDRAVVWRPGAVYGGTCGR